MYILILYIVCQFNLKKIIFDVSGTFPIDTTKTRLQIQGQTIDRSLTELKYRGMSHAFFRIIREEGLQSLYSG